MRLVNSATYSRALVTGYYAAGDGGGGVYYFDPGDTSSTDNGGTIIVGAASARWKLLLTGGGNASVRQFGAKGDDSTDDTAAFNNCILWHQNHGGEVYVPVGNYICTHILFGSQSTSGESSHPTGFYGNGWGSNIIAKTGTTGTLFQGWSLAGCHMHDFQVSVDATTSCLPFDVRWNGGVGPSTQNRFEHIRISNGTSPIVADFDNDNDAVFSQVICGGTSSQYVSMVASGGLNWMDSCIWSGCYLKFGAQNGQISNSWGNGICFAAGCLNYLHLNGLWLYGNATSGHILWSESFSSFQSVHALTMTACQITGPATNGIFDLNLYSKAKIEGCQFINTSGMSNLFGSDCRSDSYAAAIFQISGGSYSSATLTQNWPAAFRKSVSGFMNDNSGGMDESVDENTQEWVTTSVPAYTAGTWLTVIPTGAVNDSGTHSVSIEWSGSTNPYLITISALAPVTHQNTAGNFGARITAAISSHLDGGTETASLRLITAANSATSGLQFTSNLGWPAGGTLTVRVRKL